MRITDFMRPYDKFKTGFVTFSEFRRAMEACGCFADVSEDEYDTILQLFKEAMPVRPYSARGPYSETFKRVSYACFCEVVQPSGDPCPPMTEGLVELLSNMPGMPSHIRLR